MSDVVSPSTPPARRRADDDRIDELVVTVAQLSTSAAVVAEQLGHLTVKVGEVGAATTKAAETLASVSSDASASPAGRELLRRVTASEIHHDDQDRRIGKLEDEAIVFRAEVRGAVNVAKVLSVITSILAGLMTVAYYFEVVAHGKVPLP